MASSAKRDNRSLATKVALRRLILDRMHFTEVTVLDACAGAGHVWTAMEDHVTIRQWTRCDIRPRQVGTLKLPALQAMRSLPIDAYNVVDIDPYGEPWDAYLELLPRLRRPTAVFLTRGHVGVSAVSTYALVAAGIPADWQSDLPRTPTVGEFLSARILAHALDYATVGHAVTVDPSPTVTYYGLGLLPHRSPIPMAPEPIHEKP